MIRIVRSFLSVFLFLYFGVGALYVRFCVFPFQKNKSDSYKTLQNSWIFFIKLMQKLKILKLEINNLDKIRNIKNSIIVSTHPSFIVIVVLMSIIPNSTCFVAERLSKNLLLKDIVKLLFIVNNQSVDDMIKETSKKFDENLNLIIFPMGIRHRKNEYPQIRRGTSLIASKTGRIIVMLNLETSYDFLQINQPFYDIGSEPVIYSIDYLGKIVTEDYKKQYPDDVTFRTEVTKQITKTLYNHKK